VPDPTGCFPPDDGGRGQGDDDGEES
jgi:hypothetical protein